MTRLLLALALSLSVAACGDDDGSNADQPDAACVGATGCNGVCEKGNEWGVGAYCTPGGGECANTPMRAAPFCTVDTSDTEFQFCTRPCTIDADCGSNARCANEGGSGPSGCFPIFCEDNTGEDAGVSDAGASDATMADAMAVDAGSP